MIIRSDWRGLPRNTSAPKRAMSYREQLIAIISIAQHARPKVTGQFDERRAHCTIFSTVVVRMGISASRPMSIADRRTTPRRRLIAAPVEGALAPHVDVSGEEQRDEQEDLREAVPAEIAQRHRPRVEESDLDVEQQEDHRDEIE